MKEIKLDKTKKVHFIGIGGINMSSLAGILLSRGYLVSGSDTRASALTEELKKNGADIYIGQRASNIKAGTGCVVYTAAIGDDNPELMRARELSLPVITRADFFGHIMKDFKDVICISGTHGKTTTTSIISQIFLDAGADPTIMAGGILRSINSNTRIGAEDLMIAEACEYKNSFLSFFPTVGVILNIKEDHIDFFKDINDIRASFRKFAERIPEGGTLVIGDAVEDIPAFTQGLKCRIVTFSAKEEGADLTAKNITFDEYARGSFDLYFRGTFLGRARLNITGEHGVYDALAAAAAAISMGVAPEQITDSLGRYSGVKRRFEIKGRIGGVTVIDDYAHHPDEINATLSAALAYPHKKLWVVFQPHTFSRTARFLNDFASALARADAVILTDIYAAREVNTFGVSSEDISMLIRELGTESCYLPTFDEVETFLLQNCMDGDVLITMGAGDVATIADNLLGL